ncbi:hypothetical protein MJO28_004123 [Puccinia striiformis f. sp. tritici]|uniref:Uncharacterized protein n=1 Tax=Puccinia striiformis f. sp. tritici TaxID=168172 RepID=A0ACC0EPR4_9BASI|nr:hypothetical protein MJO28_004123 [Puccinia striiformis f. sp. tritici]
MCNSVNLVRPRVKIGGFRKTSLHKHRISRRRRLRTLYSLHSSQLKRSLNIKISVWHSDQEATILFTRTWLNQPFNVLFDSKKTQHLTTHYKFFTGTKKPSMMSNVCNSTNLARPRVKIWGFRKTSLHEHRISRRRRRESIRTRVLERLKPDANLFPLASPYSSQPALHPSHPEVQRQESSTHVETGLNDNAWFDESTANLPHQPGPYEEIGFGIPHYQDEQLQPGVTSSIQQATHPISSDLPGPDQGPSNQVETGLNDNSWFDEYTANLPQHPGPYKEFDFSVLFSKDVRIQTGPTSSNQQPTNPISSDLPGHSMEALPQEFEPRPMQVEPSQTPNVLGEGRQSAMGLPGPSRAGPSNRHQVPKSLVMYRFPDFAVEDEGFFREIHEGWACKYPACMKRWGLEARRDNMLAHWVSHSDDTPFACNVEEFHPPAHGQEPCSRIYKRVNELKKHVQNDHNVQVWQKGFSRTRAFAEMDTDEAPRPTQGQQRR